MFITAMQQFILYKTDSLINDIHSYISTCKNI